MKGPEPGDPDRGHRIQPRVPELGAERLYRIPDHQQRRAEEVQKTQRDHRSPALARVHRTHRGDQLTASGEASAPNVPQIEREEKRRENKKTAFRRLSF